MSAITMRATRASLEPRLIESPATAYRSCSRGCAPVAPPAKHGAWGNSVASVLLCPCARAR
jgi:hypothetical protein